MSDAASDYSSDFYDQHREGSRRSAGEIVPIVLELMNVTSVVDVGCGIGTWLAVFAERGVSDIRGIDFHRSTQMLEIPADRYLLRDLAAPLDVERQFDLVVSVEVGEHIPGECAGTFVRSLTSLGPVVLFSAAVPYQGGTHHVNEQWQSYWVARFAACGYQAVDCIRGRVWDNERVKWFYRQNILLFVKADRMHEYPSLVAEQQRPTKAPVSMAHPHGYAEAQRLRLAMEDICQSIPVSDTMVVIDDQQFNDAQMAVRQSVRFMERDGGWCEQPASDAAALKELDRLKEAGARFLVFVWPAYWWLSHYAGMNRYLRSQCRCILENERVTIFDMANAPAAMAETKAAKASSRITRRVAKSASAEPTVYFLVPTHEVTADSMPKRAEDYWKWISSCRQVDSWGPYDWGLYTYLRLSEAGVPCKLTHTLPDQGIVVAHRDFFPDDAQPGPDLLMVCIVADRTQPGFTGLHRFSQLFLVQNPRDEMLEEPDPFRQAAFMPFWPQAGLLPRNPERGDRFENAAYFGWPQNLADALHESAWRARLSELGLRWRVIPRWQWNDYSEVDVVVAIRSFSGHPFDYKPATKLYQAWHAGVPAVLGAESAYIAERRSDLDYLEAASFDEAVAGLRRLHDDPSLRRAMAENGKRRAEESSPRSLVERWSAMLNDVAKPAWHRWRELSDYEQHEFLNRRAAARFASEDVK